MAHIPRKHYAQAHLEQIRFLTGIDDWFSFLDRPDRLPYLMEISEPWHESLSIRYMLEPGVMEWKDLCLLVGTNFYGLWTEQTDRERWIWTIVSKMMSEWHACGGFFYPNASNYHNENSFEAERIWERYLQLIDQVKSTLR